MLVIISLSMALYVLDPSAFTHTALQLILGIFNPGMVCSTHFALSAIHDWISVVVYTIV